MTAATPPMRAELDNAGVDTLLPDEDVAAFKALRDSLLEEFAPRSTYQFCLAMNLVSIEWEMARHRRLMAATLRQEFRHQAHGVITRGAPGKSFHNVGHVDAVDFGRGVLAGSPETIPVLAKAGVTVSEITAAALSSRLDAVCYHDGRISDLERRRRNLREDYERLQAKRSPPDTIEDAMEVL